MGLVEEFDLAELAYLAPEAAEHTWYPYSFLAPLEQNQPWLDSAFKLVADTLQRVITSGIERIRSLSSDFLKVRVWQQNSWRGMPRVTVVSSHLREDLLVRRELNSSILASFQGRPPFSVRAIAIPMFPGRESRNRPPRFQLLAEP